MIDYDLLLDLQRRVETLETLTNASGTALSVGAHGVNFDVNPNAFVSKYAHGKTGKEKFTWLVALLAKGDEATEISVKDIEKMWNRMTAQVLMGMKFNPKYPNEAKTKGWVDSSRPGYYRLAAGWYEICEVKEKE